MKFNTHIGPAQNLGLFDRLFRIFVGTLLVIAALGIYPQDSSTVVQVFSGLFSVYPFLTGMFGWDPLYYLVGTRSCSLSGRNQCGTLPYQVDAAFGHNPVPDADYDHSLSGSHHA